MPKIFPYGLLRQGIFHMPIFEYFLGAMGVMFQPSTVIPILTYPVFKHQNKILNFVLNNENNVLRTTYCVYETENGLL